ncbi:uncharacterized protein LOC141902627 [Tubulanus polymorphus]|uniref:uncharacterized protein LOC141902627 n=1 Tax=Tubulanus polymorphus TaxID=672921 RepID=UPI003DA24D3B
MFQGYMEDKLNRLDRSARGLKWTDTMLPVGIALGFLVLVPYLHIGVVYRMWTPDKGHIDRNNCSCSCFDTVFRGAYEYPISGYKHVYFNATNITLKIFALSVVFIILAYECVRHIFLIYRYSRMSYSMLIIVLASIYPHYYSWWSYFSYLNEEYYWHWYHDMFFSLTEVVTSVMALHLLDRKVEKTTLKLLVIFNINTVHVLASGFDQFIEHVILKKGANFQIYRNWGLMIPDLISVMVVMFEFYRMMQKRRKTVKELFYKEEILMSVLFILLGTILVDLIQY